MPTPHFITIKNQPYEVRATSDFYFNKVTRVIASFTQGVDVRSLNECAEAVKTAIIPSLPGRVVSYNPITETYNWNISEEEISEVLLQIYEVNLLIDVEMLQEDGASEESIKAAQDKLNRFREARRQDAIKEGKVTEQESGEPVVSVGEVKDLSPEDQTEDQKLKEMQKRLAAQE